MNADKLSEGIVLPMLQASPLALMALFMNSLD